MTTPSYIFRLLPPKWYDDPLLQGIASAVAGPLDEWRTLLEGLHEKFDPVTAPETWLDWLMSMVALPTATALAAANKRALIAVAMDTWTGKGPADIIEAYIQAATDITAQVVAGTPSFIAGVSYAGDVCGYPGPFDIQVPTGSITEAELRRLLIPVVPVFITYTVTFI